VRAFRESAIRHKLTLILMGTSGAALLAACVAFAVYDTLTFRGAMANNLATAAEIVGQNGASAMASGDREAASQVLSTLRAKPDILAAGAYSKDGSILAEYYRQNVSTPLLPKTLRGAAVLASQHWRTESHLITRNGVVVGTIYVESDGMEWRDRLWRNALVGLIVMLAGAGVALLLFLRLQHLVSDPIMGLLRTSQTAMRERNLSPLAPMGGEDELALLGDNNKELLLQIEERDDQLRKHQQDLDLQIATRTAELQAQITQLTQAKTEAEQAQGEFIQSSKCYKP
jgi:hypothetical protein